MIAVTPTPNPKGDKVNIAIQISPAAKSAYFQSYIEVAEAELVYVLGDIPRRYVQIGSFDFFHVEIPESLQAAAVRLSFAQGIFAIEGDALRPLDEQLGFQLHEDFVFGSKYRGKTNELLTQLLLNVGLATLGSDPLRTVRILDPMCGRGTTLFWAMRYGIDAYGLDNDVKAMPEIRRQIKKWTKVHRQKHSLNDTFRGVRPNKQNLGVCLQFQARGTSFTAIHGDSRKAKRLCRDTVFDLIISDIPYGVQHTSAAGTRNALQVIKESLSSWKASLHQDGAVVISFNRNLPKRKSLVAAFIDQGFQEVDFTIPHRMSESIVRDVAIFVPAGG